MAATVRPCATSDQRCESQAVSSLGACCNHDPIRSVRRTGREVPGAPATTNKRGYIMKRLWTAALGTLVGHGLRPRSAGPGQGCYAARLQEFRAQRDAMKHGAYPGSAVHWFGSDRPHRRAPRSNAASRARAGRNPLMKVVDGSILIDAIAKPGQAQALRTELVSRGLQHATVFGNVVSGRLPVSALADLAASQLIAVRAAVRARTRCRPGDLAGRSFAECRFGAPALRS